MRSSEEAGGSNDPENISMSSMNFVLGMDRSFVPSIMFCSEMFATGASSLLASAAAALLLLSAMSSLMIFCGVVGKAFFFAGTFQKSARYGLRALLLTMTAKWHLH